MKAFKKIMAVVMTAAIAVSALTFSSAAATKTIKSGKAVNFDLKEKNSAYYTFTSAAKGTLSVSFSNNDITYSTLSVYDDGGEDLKIKTIEVGNGEIRDGGKGKTFVKGYYNSSTDRFSVKCTYAVKKGTYTIKVSNSYYYSGTATLKATFPTKAAKPVLKPQKIQLTMAKGDVLQLGATVTAEGGRFEYTSSKTSVATVSSDGKVTAKGEGTTTITIKYGTGKLTLIIKVTK